MYKIRIADSPDMRRHLPDRVKRERERAVRKATQIQFGEIVSELEEIKQHVASLERLVLDIGEAARDAIEEPTDEPEI